MVTLTSRDFADVTVFAVRSVDGYDDESWCVAGKLHVRVANNELARCRRDGRRLLTGEPKPCDGSCRTGVDVRKRVNELAFRWDNGDGRKRRTPVHLDEAVRALLRGESPVLALCYENGYCKRDSKWENLCFDRRVHVKFHTEFAWAHGGSEGFIHSVRCVPCDESCTRVANVDRQIVTLILRHVRRISGQSAEAAST